MGQNGGFMKIRSNASLVKHLKSLVYILAVCVSLHSLTVPSTIVTQFRAPMSLSELLHEGLLSVQDDIENAAALEGNAAESMFTATLEKIESLQNLYDLRNTKSGLNEIHTDERDFLQTLIDRIDQMIQKLEGDSSTTQSEVIKRGVDLLHTLRMTLED